MPVATELKKCVFCFPYLILCLLSSFLDHLLQAAGINCIIHLLILCLCDPLVYYCIPVSSQHIVKTATEEPPDQTASPTKLSMAKTACPYLNAAYIPSRICTSLICDLADEINLQLFLSSLLLKQPWGSLLCSLLWISVARSTELGLPRVVAHLCTLVEDQLLLLRDWRTYISDT